MTKNESIDTEGWIKKALTIDEEKAEIVDQMIQKTYREDIPNFLDYEGNEVHIIPVENAEIRAVHIKPENPISKRPLVFIPGWGGTPKGYQLFYEGIHERIETYYIETREKASSVLDRKNARMDMSQKIKDVVEAMKYLGLDKKDHVVLGSCWGASLIIQGLLDQSGIEKSPTIVLYDPMNRLIFSKFFLKYVSKMLPVAVLNLLKPILKWIKMGKMEQKAQKERFEEFIKSGDTWKWKKSAEQAAEFEILGNENIQKIEKTVYIIHGVADQIHEADYYPRIAKEFPNGRFFYMKIDEKDRERLITVAGEEFAKVIKEEGVPDSLKRFEKDLK